MIQKSRQPKSRYKEAEAGSEARKAMPTSFTSRTASGPPNVFGFMESPSTSDIKRTASTSSSGYAASDGGSSLTAATTGFKSPFASPILTQKQGYQESWVHQDKLNSDSGISVRGSSPESHDRRQASGKPPSVLDAEDDDDDDDEDEDQDENENDDEDRNLAVEKLLQNAATVSGAHSSATTRDDHHIRRLQEREQELHQHVIQNPGHQRYYQPYGAVPYDMSLFMHFPNHDTHHGMPQWYGYPPPPAPPVPSSDAASFFQTHPQLQTSYPVPESTRATVAGYELIASRLSDRLSNDSGTDKIRPIYRRFERLNHRILLHLQDEICELEEQLRSLDERIAQAMSGDGNGHTQPASRRAEARFGGPWHCQRRDLLGVIFLKLDQYSEQMLLKLRVYASDH